MSEPVLRLARVALALSEQKQGGIGAQLMAALLAEVEFIPLMRNAIVDGLKAMKAHTNRGEVISETPDLQVRLDAAKLALAYGEGLPMQRILAQTMRGTNPSLVDALNESPELAVALERELEKAKFRRRNVKTVAAAPEIEVPPTSQ